MSETTYSLAQPKVNLHGIKLSDGMHPAGFPPLTAEVLESIVQRIAANPDVEQVILFGSYANPSGMPTPDSDIDLLIIMESTQTPAQRALTVSRLLRPRPFPMDILVRKPDEITVALENRDGFFQEIMVHGKMLYERGN